ncbi:General alpha-glucoside permease [Cocos nucifera]|uniref:General alpha-glucoside permease n=1 Tax=Cocos nucifera TaxID=13894 RepID=A0A8K0NAK7_COCNU|nr:General alpha-glucoside permease [Cocos nucifera]
MDSPGASQFSEDKESVEEETAGLTGDAPKEKEAIEVERRVRALRWSPLSWFRMLADEMHWSFVFGVVTVNGISQGLGGAIWRVASDYYWKDVQKVQPSAAQVYHGITSLPWIVKPLWGLLTDVLPMAGKLHIMFALMAMTAGSAGVAIADVAIDACVAQNSINHPALAADMQSLCLLLISSPYELILKFYGSQFWNSAEGDAYTKLFLRTVFKIEATSSSKFTKLSMQGTIGFIFSVGSVGSLLGVLLYQNVLKDYPFRGLLFWSQLLSSLSGMLDLILVFRLNLKVGMPDFFFVVIDDCVSQMVGQLKWMPLLVLSSKLCPLGIEGTFFALLMSIENAGVLTSSWAGGLLLHMLKVTRAEFSNLWVAVLIRNIMRALPLALLCLVPKSDLSSTILPAYMLTGNDKMEAHEAEVNDIELVSLVDKS